MISALKPLGYLFSDLPNHISWYRIRQFLVMVVKEPCITTPTNRYHIRHCYYHHVSSDSQRCLDAKDKHDMNLVLYDSLSKRYQKIVPFVASSSSSSSSSSDSPKGLAWYTCGPTTYAPAHLGHARTYVWIDIIRRILEFVHDRSGDRTHGRPPLFVMNITDVDDKILAAAKEAGESPVQLARKFEREFWRDMDALGCQRPHVVTRVTECVESVIVPYIDQLVSMGMAYVIPERGVYFHVRAFEEKLGHATRYGKLAPPAAATDFYHNMNRPRDVAMGDVTQHTNVVEKHDERDFVLWKYRKDGEELFWKSPWGAGRPGWHIECSAMIEAVQLKFHESHVFLVHAGGIDLKFPHHTNEIAQAEAFHNRNNNNRPKVTENNSPGEWISHWVHTGHVHIDGLKMSKSLKNFITIQEILSKDKDVSSPLVNSADDFRLWCLGLSGSYRGPATFSYDQIQTAQTIRQKIVRFLLDGEEWLRRADGADSVKNWRPEDVQFFQRVNDAYALAFRSMLGSDETSSPFDVDGGAFVEQLLKIAEDGSSFLRVASPKSTPMEPLVHVLSMIRKLLSLVGFTEATTHAGLLQYGASSNVGQQEQVVGGERALIEELVRYRSLVRQAALDMPKDVDESAKKLRQLILQYSDDVRKNRMPAMGIEIMDPKSVDVSKEDDDMIHPSWRFCLPMTASTSTSTNHDNYSSDGIENLKAGRNKMSNAIDMNNIPIKDFFRVGQFEGQFSDFTADGVPTRHADGSEISKTQLKKLLKKRDKHVSHHQAPPMNPDNKGNAP